MSKNIIEIIKLYKNFKNINSTIKVLKDINLNLETGKLIALMGPSGSGKSTLLHLLALLDKPSKGKIHLLGKDTDGISEDQKNLIIRNNISIIFQNNNLLSDFNSLENVAIPLIIRGNNYNFSVNKAAKILSKVNLGHRLEHFPNDLSGGEQQRVAIARSIASDTNIILADEPTGNLDPEVAEKILKILMDINKKGTSIIMTTHNYQLMQKYKRDIYVCENGIFYKKN